MKQRWFLPALALIWAGSAVAAPGPGPQAISATAAPLGYHLLRSIPLPGDKGWDYCLADSAARRLYVTHGDRLQVLSLDDGSLLATLGPYEGIHGVALAPDLGRGYVSDGKAGKVEPFELASFKRLPAIVGRPDADAIIYEPQTAQVFAFNGDDGSATIIDARTDSVVATLALGGKPEFCAVDGRGHVFVNLEDKDLLLTLDAARRSVLRRSPVAPGSHPAALSMDVEDGDLFVGCHNEKAVIVDAASGVVKGSLAIGGRVDASTYDPGLGVDFHSCGDGTVWAAQKGKDGAFHALPPLATQRGSRTLAVDRKDHRLYLPAADFGPPPPPSAERPHPWPRMKPGTFKVLVYGRD